MLALDDLVPREPIQYLYRFVDHMFNGHVHITLRRYPVLRRTPRGFWINVDGYPPKEKWVMEGKGKRFAHEHIQDAAYSFRRRKLAQRDMLTSQLKRVEAICNAIDGKELPTEAYDWEPCGPRGIHVYTPEYHYDIEW